MILMILKVQDEKNFFDAGTDQIQYQKIFQYFTNEVITSQPSVH